MMATYLGIFHGHGKLYGIFSNLKAWIIILVNIVHIIIQIYLQFLQTDKIIFIHQLLLPGSWSLSLRVALFFWGPVGGPSCPQWTTWCPQGAPLSGAASPWRTPSTPGWWVTTWASPARQRARLTPPTFSTRAASMIMMWPLS